MAATHTHTIARPPAGPRRRGVSRMVLLAVLGVVVVLGGGGYAAIQIMRNSGALRGQAVHDFGVVPITGRETSFKHVFELVNATDEPLYIAGARPSCGCAGATFSPGIVQPGGTLRVEATLALSKSGYKDANVEIYTPGEYTKKLFLKATGRREMPLWSPRAYLQIRDSRSVLDLPIAAETYGRSEPPPTPEVTVPDQFVLASVGEWRLVRPEKSGSDQGAQWTLSIRLDYNGLPVANDAAAIIRMTYEGKPVEIVVPIRKGEL